MVPPQEWSVLQEIQQKNFILKMALFRPSDSKMSENGLKFHYMPHAHGETDIKFDMDKVDYEKRTGEKIYF